MLPAMLYRTIGGQQNIHHKRVDIECEVDDGDERLSHSSAHYCVDSVCWCHARGTLAKNTQTHISKNLNEHPQIPLFWMVWAICISTLMDALIVQEVAGKNANLNCRRLCPQSSFVRSGWFSFGFRIVRTVFLCYIFFAFPLGEISSSLVNVVCLTDKKSPVKSKTKSCKFLQNFGVEMTVWTPQQHIFVECQDAVGDGNCLWRAAAKFTTQKWYSLKRKTLKHLMQQAKQRHASEQIHIIRKLSKRNAWGNSLALCGIASYLQRDICVMTDKAMIWVRSPQSGLKAQTIFLSLHSQHYSPAVRSSAQFSFKHCTRTAPISFEEFSKSQSFFPSLCFPKFRYGDRSLGKVGSRVFDRVKTRTLFDLQQGCFTSMHTPKKPAYRPAGKGPSGQRRPGESFHQQVERIVKAKMPLPLTPPEPPGLMPGYRRPPAPPPAPTRSLVPPPPVRESPKLQAVPQALTTSHEMPLSPPKRQPPTPPQRPSRSPAITDDNVADNSCLEPLVGSVAVTPHQPLSGYHRLVTSSSCASTHPLTTSVHPHVDAATPAPSTRNVPPHTSMLTSPSGSLPDGILRSTTLETASSSLGGGSSVPGQRLCRVVVCSRGTIVKDGGSLPAVQECRYPGWDTIPKSLHHVSDKTRDATLQYHVGVNRRVLNQNLLHPPFVAAVAEAVAQTLRSKSAVLLFECSEGSHHSVSAAVIAAEVLKVFISPEDVQLRHLSSNNWKGTCEGQCSDCQAGPGPIFQNSILDVVDAVRELMRDYTASAVVCNACSAAVSQHTHKYLAEYVEATCPDCNQHEQNFETLQNKQNFKLKTSKNVSQQNCQQIQHVWTTCVRNDDTSSPLTALKVHSPRVPRNPHLVRSFLRVLGIAALADCLRGGMFGEESCMFLDQELFELLSPVATHYDSLSSYHTVPARVSTCAPTINLTFADSISPSEVLSPGHFGFSPISVCDEAPSPNSGLHQRSEISSMFQPEARNLPLQEAQQIAAHSPIEQFTGTTVLDSLSESSFRDWRTSPVEADVLERCTRMRDSSPSGHNPLACVDYRNRSCKRKWQQICGPDFDLEGDVMPNEQNFPTIDEDLLYEHSPVRSTFQQTGVVSSCATSWAESIRSFIRRNGPCEAWNYSQNAPASPKQPLHPFGLNYSCSDGRQSVGNPEDVSLDHHRLSPVTVVDTSQDPEESFPSPHPPINHVSNLSGDDTMLSYHVCVLNGQNADLEGGAKGDQQFLPNKVDVSKMVQKLKEIPHGLQPKQVRMLLVSDNRLMQKIQRTTDPKHLLDCVTAAAKRMGVPILAQTSQQTPSTSNARPLSKTEGKGQGTKHGKGKSDIAPAELPATGIDTRADQKTFARNSKGNGKGKGKRLENRSPVKFSLDPHGWNVKPLQEFVPHHGAVYLTESEEEAKKLSEQAAGKPFPIAVLCPKPFCIGVGDPESLFVEVERTQNGTTQKVSMQAYLHQLTAHEVTYMKTAARVHITKPDTSKTAVLYVTYCDEGASAQTQLEIQQKKIPAIRQWIISAISAQQKHFQHEIQDTWHPQYVKKDGDKTWYQISIRVKQQDVDKFLSISAPGKIQINGPASVKGGIHHLWLKANGRALPEEDVQDILQQFHGLHLGAFWLRGTWAIRARVKELEQIKQQLGRTEEPAYFLGNCSPEWDVTRLLPC